MEKKLPIDQWQKIQKEIASKVTILPDDVSLLNDCPGSHEFCYHTSKLPASSSSFSSSSSSSYRPLLLEEKLIGGVDLSFPPGQSCSDHPDDDHTAVAVYVILRNYQVIYQDSLMFTIVQPYTSSFLAFREIEPIQTLIHRQKRHRPDLTPHVILVDGNGILHERKAGLATFVGVTMNVPTIGVAKTLYCMDGLSVKMVESQVAWSLDRLAQYCCGCGYGYDSGCLLAGKNSKDGNNNAGDSRSPEAVCIFCKTPISPIRTDVCVELLEGKRTDGAVIAALEAIKEYCDGLSIPLMGNQGQILGAALVGHGGKIASGRAKRKKQCGTKNPIYISIGHDISLQEAVVLCCALSLARIPEPIRQADLIGREIMKNYKRL